MSCLPLASRFRTALVTGAGAGLGRAFAEQLRAEGVEVWGTSRRPETLPVAERFHPLRLELADGAAAAETLVAEVERASGGLDLLVHNAGYGVFGDFGALSVAAWQRQIDDLLDSSLALTHAAWATMAPRHGGAIVTVTSMAVEFPIPFLAGYNVAKAGLAALAGTMMLEAPAAGITVIDFRPGDYRTSFNTAMFAARTAGRSAAAARVARRLEALLAAAPPPERAARDLVRALRRGRSGVIRSGSFFQTVAAPLGARLVPSALRRAVMARYFGVR